MRIILVSHGNFAKGLYESATMLIGKLEGVEIVILQEEDTPATFKANLEAKLTNEECLILCDIVGGTPCNQSLVVYAQRDNIEVIAGLNMVMLIESYLKKDEPLNEVCDALVTNSRASIQHVSKLIAQSREEDIDLE